MTGTAAVAIDWDRVLAFRLRRHFLDSPASGAGPAAVATAVGGLHAQVASCAELSVTLRTEGVPPTAVQDAVADRRLVKTWAMRGTLHLFAVADLPLYVAAGRLRRGHLTASWLRYQGVSREELEAILAAVPKALEGRVLTRVELAAEVADLVGNSSLKTRLESGWGDLFKPSAYRGDLCFGPSQGRNVTFASPRDWVGGPPFEEPAPDVAIVEVARRFAAAYGPVTREDFGRWWGCQPAEAGRVLGRIEGLVPVDVEGHRAFALADDLADIAGGPEPAKAALVPGFDPYVVAAAPRAHERIVPAGAKELIYRPQGWISAVALHRGRMCAVWRHELRNGRLAVAFDPLEKVPAALRKAFAAEAERLAARLGTTSDVTWTA